MEVLEDQQQRDGRGDRLERLADLAQHALSRGAEDLLFQGLAMLARQQRGELHQPRRRVRGERIDDRGADGATTELTDRLEHRIERLLGPKSLDALPVRDAHRWTRGVDLSLELFRQRRLADAGLTRDEDDLRLPGTRAFACRPTTRRAHLPGRRGGFPAPVAGASSRTASRASRRTGSPAGKQSR